MSGAMSSVFAVNDPPPTKVQKVEILKGRVHFQVVSHETQQIGGDLSLHVGFGFVFMRRNTAADCCGWPTCGDRQRAAATSPQRKKDRHRRCPPPHLLA